MEPMPPLVGAVHPPRVEPPTFFDRHPRIKAGVDLLFPTLWMLLMVMWLKRDGFNWLVVAALVLASGTVGGKIATFPTRDDTPNPQSLGSDAVQP